MADINKFTTKEVLNKVLLDSSGDAVAAFSHTTQEALNAVLDTTNNRLNVSIAGGTISGDVTISGDLTVEGGGSLAFDEIVEGTMALNVNNSNSDPQFQINNANASGRSHILFQNTSRSTYWAFGQDSDNDFKFANHVHFGSNVRMTLTAGGSLGIGTDSPSGDGLTGSASPALEISGTYPVLQLHDTDDDNYKAVMGTNSGIVYLGGTGSAITALQLYVQGGLKMKLDANSRVSLSNNDSGTENTVFGYTAGANIDAGSNYNVYIGHQTAGNGTHNDAVMNTAVGYRAMYPLTSGDYNTALGADSLRLITTGAYNVAIGANALAGADGAEANNIAIGESAMLSVNLDTSEKNIAIGRLALTGGTGELIGNVAIGHLALDATGSNAQTGVIAIGMQSLTSLAAGRFNTAVGYQSGYSATAAENFTYIGYQAGYSGSGNHSSTYVGYQAGYGGGSGSGGERNVGVGASALANTNGGSDNTAVGKDALIAITSGDNHVAIGANAGDALTTSSNNVVIGKGALSTATTALNNVFIGRSAGEDIQAAQALDGVVAIGWEAFKGSGSTTTGADGTIAIGKEALKALTTGAGNTVIGYQAGATITTGSNNVALGYNALNGITTKGNNVALGYNAMNGATNTQQAIAIGSGALDALSSAAAEGHVAIGHNALGAANSNGSNGAVAIGHSALQAVTSQSGNTAVGVNAGISVASAGNTLIGHNAGNLITTGSENTIVGNECDVASNDNTNNIILGNNLTATDKDNAVFIGNDTNHIENDFNADAAWNYSSDERQKKDIKDDTLGLDFINDLRPVTYKHKSPSEFPKEWSAYDADDKEPMGGDKTIHGLIAQEVKQALDNQGVDTFGGWSVGDDGRQRISAEKMVMPLIKAVQELSAKVEELEAKLSK